MISGEKLVDSDLNKKANFVIEWQNNYWTRLSQNIYIYQCFADHDILLNFVQ